MTLSGDALESLYTTMVRIRRFDEKTTELFSAGLVKGTAHSYVGEEAVAAGACANLREGDYIVGTHRGHGHCIAKGARVDRMMAELMGRADGYCRGLGGSMHIAALDLNILGCNGIVAAGLPIGTGAALAAKLRKTDNVVVAFFGDGGANQGVVHEALNLAAVWKLPAIYLCENNQYALSTATGRTTAGDSIAAGAAAYGIPGVRVDGNDGLAGYEPVRTAVARAHRGADGSVRVCAPRRGQRARDAGRARAHDGRGAQRGAPVRDAARRAGLRHGGGRRPDRRHLRRDARAPRALWRGPRARHADLGGDVRGRRRGRGDRRAQACGRDPDLRLRRAHDGPARQPGGEVPLHARRPAHRAARDPRAPGRRHPPRRPALAEPRGVVRPRARARRRRARDALRRQGAARLGDPRRQPGDLPRAQGPQRDEGRGAGGALRDPAGESRREEIGRASCRERV